MPAQNPHDQSEPTNRAARRARARGGKGAVTHTVNGGKVSAGHRATAAAPRQWAMRRS